MPIDPYVWRDPFYKPLWLEKDLEQFAEHLYDEFWLRSYLRTQELRGELIDLDRENQIRKTPEKRATLWTEFCEAPEAIRQMWRNIAKDALTGISVINDIVLWRSNGAGVGPHGAG